MKTHKLILAALVCAVVILAAGAFRLLQLFS